MPSFRNATEGTGIGNTVTDGAGRLGFARGNKGYAAFNATGSAWSRTFSTSLPNGQYCNVARGTYRTATGVCTGGVITVSGGTFTTSIPANRGVALHINAVTQCTDPNGCQPDNPPTGFTRFTATVETNPGQEVYVVGSIPALGSWTPANGVRLTTGPGSYPTWTGAVELPSGTAFEWKLVKIGNGATVWENGANRTGTGGASLNAVWGQTGGGGTSAAVSFHVNATTSYGQNVFLVGSVPALGSWNPASAVAMSSNDYPVWKVTVSLPTNQQFEYKLIKKEPNGTVIWESGPNRTHTPTGAVTLTDTWR